MSLQVSPSIDVEVDLRAVFRSIRRKLPIFIVLALLVGAGVYVLLSRMPPSYTAQTTILIETGETDLTQATPNPAETATLLDAQGIASQVQLIRSRDVARAVIDDLDLTTRPEFDPAQQEPGLIDSLLAKIGVGGDEGPAPPVEEVVLAEFLGALEVNPIEQTRVISISFTSSDPQLAADIANAVAAEYIEMQRTARQLSAADATQWLQDEIDDLSNRVQDAEAQVEEFRSSQDLLQIGPEEATLAEQQMADIAEALSAQSAARIEAQARADQIQAQLDSGAEPNAPEIINSQLIQNLREQQSTVRAEIAQQSAVYLPGHPQIQALNAQLGDLDDAIRDEIERILNSILNEAALAQTREEQLTQELDALKAEVTRANAATVQLNALQRVADADSQFLELYLSRYREAVTRLDTEFQPVNARVISEAAAPLEPEFPKPIPMTIGAMILTVILCAAFTLVRELSSGRAVRPAARAPIPVMPAEIAARRVRWSDDGDVRRMMPYDPGTASALAEQVERSLAAIASQIRSKNARRVLITMAEGTSEQGRPLAAVALARTLARSGSRVLLVDLHRDDADRIAMGEAAGLPGFGDLFSGTASFAQVIFRDRASSAHFIPAGRESPEPVADRERLTTLLGALDHTYDHVLYDIDEAMVPLLGPTAGAAIVVTEFGPADPRTVRAYDTVTAASNADVMLLVTEPAPVRAANEAAGKAAGAAA